MDSTFTKRILDGMDYERQRQGPPDNFPQFPDIPGGRYTDADFLRLEWEHLQKVLADCDGNVSAAARQLGMHRRTLQRKLNKRPVRLH